MLGSVGWGVLVKATFFQNFKFSEAAFLLHNTYEYVLWLYLSVCQSSFCQSAYTKLFLTMDFRGKKSSNDLITKIATSPIPVVYRILSTLWRTRRVFKIWSQSKKPSKNDFRTRLVLSDEFMLWREESYDILLKVLYKTTTVCAFLTFHERYEFWNTDKKITSKYGYWWLPWLRWNNCRYCM